jgi:hypothetical protein
MGFAQEETPYYDLGNNGHLPENVNHYDKTAENWSQYLGILPTNHIEELVHNPTALGRINEVSRAYDYDAQGNVLPDGIQLDNHFCPITLRKHLSCTGSSITDFVLQHNITTSYFDTTGTEFNLPFDKKIRLIEDSIKTYLESTGQTLNNLNSKIARAQIWRYFTRALDNQLTDSHPMLKELQIIGLIHNGDLETEHLSPHMLQYCKLNLTYRGNRPYGGIHGTANLQAFSVNGTNNSPSTPLIWTLHEHHINGIHAVCAKLDELIQLSSIYSAEILSGSYCEQLRDWTQWRQSHFSHQQDFWYT